VLSDPHAPDNFRVNGVVRNDDGWYQAFAQIGAGDKYFLTPAERVRLW
jgi:putative endopeptidase